MLKFTSKTSERLKHYVYLYIDPRNKKVFYVGKGKGNRAFAHLQGSVRTDKLKIIRELKKLGLEPQIEILKYGLTEKEALLVEATAIDLLDIENLTNEVRGHGTRYGSRASVQEVQDLLAAREAKITHPVILINIARAHRYGMSPQELYDTTRSAWKFGPRRLKARYALSVYKGVIREVYTIAGWTPGGSTMRSTSRDGRQTAFPGRWEFVGQVAPEKVRKKYLNRSVTRYLTPGSQNPIHYVNC